MDDVPRRRRRDRWNQERREVRIMAEQRALAEGDTERY